MADFLNTNQGGRASSTCWSRMPERQEPERWTSQLKERERIALPSSFVPFGSSVAQMTPAHIGEGVSLFSVHWMLTSSRDTLTDTPRNDVLPALRVSLSLVRLTMTCDKSWLAIIVAFLALENDVDPLSPVRKPPAGAKVDSPGYAKSVTPGPRAFHLTVPCHLLSWSPSLQDLYFLKGFFTAVIERLGGGAVLGTCVQFAVFIQKYGLVLWNGLILYFWINTRWCFTIIMNKFVCVTCIHVMF